MNVHREELIGRYRRLLEGWHRASEEYRHAPRNIPGTICYGTGYNKWGVQTQQKAFAATAVLAAEPEVDESNAGQTQEEVLDCALRMLRFSLRTHVEGDADCLDGTKWGHTWISALGVERMMHGVEAIEANLTPADHALLQKVLISESDWLLDNYEIVSGLENATGRNKPESNLWNGALLHRTAMLYPDCERAKAYRAKGTRFLANSISIPDDAISEVLVDGQPLRDLHVGANFFPTYALNHHGYLNVGYMVICLSNAAMFHFACKSRGIEAPESLYHHVTDLWQLVRRCTFDDGRLLRIGGDTRVRYCYCQDYAIPMWQMMEDKYGDPDCRELESRWLSQVETEVQHHGDGTFLRQRVRPLEHVSPLYYTRLESDRAVTLSMGLYWRRLMEQPQAKRIAREAVDVRGGWHDSFHGSCLQRDPARIASWTWEAAEKPQGLCLPPTRSDMAEWRYNLAGRIQGLGACNYGQVVDHEETSFSGGFLTWGQLEIQSEAHVAEGQLDETVAKQYVVWAALPDGKTVAVLQFATAVNRVYLSEIKGLGLSIPNDLFNGMTRTYASRAWQTTLAGCPQQEEIIPVPDSWLNVDDCLSVISLYGDDTITIVRPARRQVGLKSDRQMHKARGGGMLYADEICSPLKKGPVVAEKDDIVLDIGFLMLSDISAAQTESYCDVSADKGLQTISADRLRIASIPGADGRKYMLAANFGDTMTTLKDSTDQLMDAMDLASGERVGAQAPDLAEIACLPGTARLFRLS